MNRNYAHYPKPCVPIDNDQPPHAIQSFIDCTHFLCIKIHPFPLESRFILNFIVLNMTIKTLRIVGFLEGLSFLLLLFIAMPLKYIWGNPILVKFVGMGHGILFILFLAVLFAVCEKQKWSIKMFILGFIASILPFGPFVFDHKLKKFES